MPRSNITTPRMPQSNGDILWGAIVNGYVVANGYKTRADAEKAAQDWSMKNLGYGG